MDKLERIIVIIASIGLFLLGFYFSSIRTQRVRKELAEYKHNSVALMQGVKEYKTKDSLKAVEMGVLSLRLKEYELFRAEDAKTIASLRTKNRSLQNVTTTQSEMIAKLSVPIRDTVAVYKTDSVYVLDSVRAFEFHDPWLDFSGSIKNNQLSADIQVRDSLLIVETVTYKRFLGFLWKTKQVKDRKVDAVSKNPYNTIKSLDRIVISP
jgi:hypothetical protein